MPFLATTLMTASSILLLETANNSNNLFCIISLDSTSTECIFNNILGWEGNDSEALLSIIPRKKSDTDQFVLWNQTHPFPLEWLTRRNICFRIQTTRPVEEFTASSMSIHPHQCPFLTVLLWSFSALLFWSMYAACIRQSYTERIQTQGEPKTSSHSACYYRHILYPNITSLPLQWNNLILN